MSVFNSPMAAVRSTGASGPRIAANRSVVVSPLGGDRSFEVAA